MQKPTNYLRSTKQILLSFNRNTTREYILSTSIFSPSRPPSFSQQTVWSVWFVQTEYCSLWFPGKLSTPQVARLCTFPLFWMAGPFRHLTHERSSSSSVCSVVALPSSEGSPDGEGKRLEVEVVLSLSMILSLLKLPSLLWGHDVSWVNSSVSVVNQGSSLN